jgi:hypothetical protein
MALYTDTLDALTRRALSFEDLEALSPFLTAVFDCPRIAPPALGPDAFERFCRARFGPAGPSRKTCPRAVHECFAYNVAASSQAAPFPSSDSAAHEVHIHPSFPRPRDADRAAHRTKAPPARGRRRPRAARCRPLCAGPRTRPRAGDS